MKNTQECEPPLEQNELDKIWASACKFYKKISSSPDYIPPDEYGNGTLKPDDFSDIGEARTLQQYMMVRFAIQKRPDFFVTMRSTGWNPDSDRLRR